MRFAAVFPGQGAQSVGMLAELAISYPVISDTYAEASEILGYNLGAIIQSGPVEALDRTQNTQPALLAAGVALWRAWNSAGGGQPAVLAGHSLGEYTALVASGTLDFAAGLRLVHLRGRLMQAAVPAGTGAMAAILGLEPERVAAVCITAGTEGLVAPANLNAPGQVVISGERRAVEKVGDLAREQGARRVIPLAVSVPSHCTLMRPAAEKLADALAGVEFCKPRIPVVNNVDIAVCDTPELIRDALVRQIIRPVRWVETITALKNRYNVEAVVEMGPGKVLSGLVKRCDRTLAVFPTDDVHHFDKARASLR